MSFGENWYSDSQLSNLVRITEEVKDLSGTIIEIGCWKGKSTVSLANSFYPEVVTCNDTWEGNVEESQITGEEHISVTLAKEQNVFEIFQENMNSLTKGNYSIVRKNCFDWIPTLGENSVKFVHIDASHDYLSVKKTIELLLPKMVKGGIMCGDDFLSANASRVDLQGGVERAVREAFPEFINLENLWVARVE